MREGILYYFFLVNSLLCFSQTEDNNLFQGLSGDIYKIVNHPKSLINFQFNIPKGFVKLREGLDNTTVQLFEKKTGTTGQKDLYGNEIHQKKIEFGLAVLKYADFPKYNKISSMSYEQKRDLIKTNLLNRNKNKYPNDFFDFHETNGLFWSIFGSWSEEKDLYTIVSSTYLDKQAINLIFSSQENYHVFRSLDLINIKKLINTFKIL